MNSDQRVQQVERDIHRLPVAKAPGFGSELIEPLPVNELGDQVPLPGAGLASPEHLDHVRVADLPQSAEFAADCIITGGIVKQLEGSFLGLELVADPVDLGETALVDYLQNLEAVVDDVADTVVGSLGCS